jgi:hypothetical protein
VEYHGLISTVKRLSAEGKAHPRASASFFRGQWSIFFAGIQPRVMWISIGGFVFFGAYEQALKLIVPLV